MFIVFLAPADVATECHVSSDRRPHQGGPSHDHPIHDYRARVVDANVGFGARSSEISMAALCLWPTNRLVF